jgi:predicted PurR-regulated permease PerM
MQGSSAARRGQVGRADSRRDEREGASASVRESRSNTPGNGAMARDPGAVMPRPHSWFAYGLRLAFGVLAAYLVVESLATAGHALVLLLMAVFLAASLTPLVDLLTAHGCGRPLALVLVAIAVLGVCAGFGALVVPPVTQEINALIRAIPKVLGEIRDRSTLIGQLEARFHIIEHAQNAVSSTKVGSVAVNGIVGAGRAVFDALTSTLAVIALTVYLLVGMPRILRFCYRLVPAGNRETVSALTDRILVQVGKYMLGKLVTSVIAGVATWAWAAPWHIPFAAALGALVGLLDMVPVIGSTIGGLVVTLVALSVSVPVALATLGFYIVFRLVEDYLVMPKMMRYTVDVHPIVTILAVLIGGTLLGIVGALVAIPIAVAVKIVVNDVVEPRLDQL